jgi:hypothetical protein
VTCCFSLATVSAEEGTDLFQQYDLAHKEDAKKNPQVPPELRTAYIGFVAAMKGDSVATFCLPAVTIPRVNALEKAKLDRRGIVPPIVRERFAAMVIVVRKEPNDCYLIRTNSTAIWFVQTKSGAWKVYHYLDKPIE